MILELDAFEKEVLLRAVKKLIENERDVIQQGILGIHEIERLKELIKLVESLEKRIASL